MTAIVWSEKLICNEEPFSLMGQIYVFRVYGFTVFLLSQTLD